MNGVKCVKPWSIITAVTTSHKPWARRALRTIHHEQPGITQTEELMILDRQALKPERAETCQSGTDDEVARHKSPYDPSKTTVESEVSALREEYKLEGDLHDPLLVSPANLDVSRLLDPTVGGAVHNLRSLGSVKGLTNKNKKVLLRTEPYVFRTYKHVFFNYKPSRKLYICS